MNTFRLALALLLAPLAAAQVSVRGPELQMSGSTISHTKTDGNCHVPRSFGMPNGYVLRTHGGSCDGYWSADTAVASDSSRASHIADSAKRAGWADSSRVSGLSDSAKKLVFYARIAALHDTADTLRKQTKQWVHDSLVATRAASTLQAAYNASTPPQITTDATRGAVDLQNGSGVDPAAVLRVLNGAGAPVAQISGTGNVTMEGRLVQGVTDRIDAYGNGFFGNLTGGGIFVRPDPLAPSGFANIYGDGVASPSASNWSLSLARNGSGTWLNATTNFGISISNAQVIAATASAITASQKIMMPSARVTGLAASKFVKTDGSKDLVSADIAEADVPNLFGDVSGNIGSNTVGKILGVTIPAWANGALRYNGGVVTWENNVWSNSAGPNKVWATYDGTPSANAFRSLAVADIPILNQNTTGSAATLTTPRTLTIGSTGKNFDGSSNVSWSLAEIGAAPAHALAAGVVIKSNGSGGFWSTTAVDNGTIFGVTGQLGWGGGSLRDYTANETWTAIYGSSVATPGNANYSAIIKKDGSRTWLNGSTDAGFAIANANILQVTSAGTNLVAGSLKVAGTDAITSARESSFRGWTDGSSAASGIVGERITSVVASGSAVTTTVGTARNVTSISVPAGDWEVTGAVTNGVAGSTFMTRTAAGISTTSATLPAAEYVGSTPGNWAAPSILTADAGSLTLRTSSASTVYLVNYIDGSGGATATAYGWIKATRVR